MKATKGNRIHIGIYGKRNTGKSTIFNLILGQNASIISSVLGTTTDTNIKPMEFLGVGAISLIDTAGYDDTFELGEKRVEKTKDSLMSVDLAILVFNSLGITDVDKNFINILKEKNIPVVPIINNFENTKISLDKKKEIELEFSDLVEISAINILRDEFLNNLKNILLSKLKNLLESNISAIPDFIKNEDNVILVIPIDKEAPRGRLILPQVQVIRELLDKSCITTVTGLENLKSAIENLKNKPKLVITDSQAFKEVDKIVPNDIKLTSFSVLFANLKGDIKAFKDGSDKIDTLKDGDKVLILESCTHHAIEDDIGKVKIPNLIKKYTKKDIVFEYYSGCDFPKNDIEKYALIIHCGACMTNRTEILSRIEYVTKKSVPITNYGISIAKCLGILERALEIFN